MNFLKRAMLSISKKKIKSLILFVVLLVIANMVLVGLSIQTATKKSTELAREKLGSDVTLKVNDQKFMEQRRNNKEEGSSSRPSLTTDIADTLKDNEHVTQYNYISSSFGLAKNFENVKNEDSSDDTNSEEKPKGMFKMGGSDVTTMPEISFSGTIATNLLSDFKDGDSKIAEGRGITKDDAGKNVAVIEKNLAKENSLKVGSKIQVASVDENTTLELEVVGIYEVNSDESTNDNRNMDFLNPYNKIYMPYDVVSKISTGDSTNSITSAVYFMDNADNIESFKEYAKNKKIDLETYTLDANDQLYTQMVGPIENVGSFSKTLVATVSIAGAMILVLIIALSLKDRKYEIGVLLSLGESKFKVISQLVVEVLLVASIAFATSAFTGNLAANKIGDTLLANEIEVTESSSTQENSNFGGRGTMVVGPGRMNSNTIKNADVVKEMDVSVTSKDLEKLAGIGLLIVIASAAIPTISVLRFSPKTILSKRE
ncbi:ABC transporter permease [Clostridium botulinum]|uniref:ABC transporter permease n=3 Tax=Clostridium botulinum TaxID=1491 RepID=A0A6B4NDG1_CLOBO|nr:ABC transporter permease [Clostridium botulinum]AJD27259.1 ftsX-like permease family protein [Clostridium botulinum CDC_297]EPS47229.1 ABC transporter permease [Clostridium botulinum A1 str. CFSAN002368]ACQ54036.1 ABC transporter, permease protein [Clostridium botulinum Ba4 str. 657]AJE10689.1 ftsX-like permease family protein [Clostridium botulinum CDC_1436]APC80812.1 ftsX-like permease family protein [Clostridium botulinum]